MDIHLALAEPEDKMIFKNFLLYYMHDLSAFSEDISVNEKGFFEYDGFEMLWQRKEISPYFILKGEEKTGFILLTQPPFAPREADYCIHELFILKAHRGRGIAEKAVMELITQHKGTFFVVQLMRNKPAIQFWRNFYSKHNIEVKENHILMDQDECVSQTFTVF